jgi:transcription initiation factor TFIIE subunit alpha
MECEIPRSHLHSPPGLNKICKIVPESDSRQLPIKTFPLHLPPADWLARDMASTSVEASTVHTLVRLVLRAFYNTRQIIAYDILLKHSSLRDIHLAQLMNLTPKEVHKFLAPLIADSLLQQHSKAEPRVDDSRPDAERKIRQRVFYFVDYRIAVDAVRWRVVQLTALLGKDSQPQETQYVCPRCGRRYSPLDALSLLSVDGTAFECMDCGSKLVEETNSGVDEHGEEKAKYARLMAQVDPIVRAMKAVDEISVPENTFTIALANAIAPFDDVDTAQDYPNLTPTLPVPDLQTTTSTTSLQIDFSELHPSATADALARRTAQQVQNALPIWHTQSTVSGELTYTAGAQKEVEKEDEGEKKVVGVEDDIAAYYAAERRNWLEESRAFEAEEADFEEEDEGEVSMGSTPLEETPKAEETGRGQAGVKNGMVQDDDDDEDEDEEFEDV